MHYCYILKHDNYRVQIRLNSSILATANVNHHVCLWNPYVDSKPNGVGISV